MASRLQRSLSLESISKQIISGRTGSKSSAPVRLGGLAFSLQRDDPSAQAFPQLVVVVPEQYRHVCEIERQRRPLFRRDNHLLSAAPREADLEKHIRARFRHIREHERTPDDPRFYAGGNALLGQVFIRPLRIKTMRLAHRFVRSEYIHPLFLERHDREHFLRHQQPLRERDEIPGVIDEIIPDVVQLLVLLALDLIRATQAGQLLQIDLETGSAEARDTQDRLSGPVCPVARQSTRLNSSHLGSSY